MTPRSVLRGATVLVVALLASPAQAAGLFRTYLSPTGNDAHPCTLPQPCRLLPAALTAVADGGEIWMLGSANYNASQVNVTKSVTILAIPGALGSVVAASGAAINIAAPGARVALRNLVIVPLPDGGATHGVVMTAGASLAIDGCLIANIPGDGVQVTGDSSVRITDSTIRDNSGDGLRLADGARATVTRVSLGGNAGSGIYLTTGAAATTSTLDVAESTLDANAKGVYVRSTNATALVRASVRDTRLVRNLTDGGLSESVAGASVTLSASANVVSNNGTGLRSAGTGKVWAAGNTVSDNATGLHNDGGTFETAASTNAVRNNYTTNSSGTITPVSSM